MIEGVIEGMIEGMVEGMIEGMQLHNIKLYHNTMTVHSTSVLSSIATSVPATQHTLP
jgi:hypothetical protein